MPGPYAQAMRSQLGKGGWPPALLTLMLHYNTLKRNFTDNEHGSNLYLVDSGVAMASCHPNAIMFMNVVSRAGYANDEEPAPPLADDLAARNVVAAQAAVMQNGKAIWVKYGLHSFVLLTGDGGEVESFEAWAAQRKPYLFHLSELVEPDDLGLPRVPGRPSREQAREALGWLLSPDVEERKAGVNRLSRAGHQGFGGSSKDDSIPGINIHIADMVDVATFQKEVFDRLLAVGFYRQRALESARGRRIVCCRCQAVASSRAEAAKDKWTECGTCARHYCRRCNDRLVHNCDCASDKPVAVE